MLQRLLEVISVYRSVPSHNDLMIDPVLEDYLKALFTDVDGGEFDTEEVLNLLKGHVPESSTIPSKVLTDWVLETRALLLGTSDGETGPSVSEAKPVNDLTACDASDHLAQFFRSMCEVRENTCRTSKIRSVAGDDERLATMEFSSFTKSKPPLLSSEVTGTAKAAGGGKLRYLNGEVVDTTGKRYIEIEKEYPNMPKPVYLKAARKYRFH
ncbi:CUE domain-containing protein 2 [Taenia solium]|eukprot:TsM_000394400 transcript=TsM_000394400 gene=TsM_000394400